jgi:DNA-directed RNA polymerase specialized sigma24 family protein
MALMKRSIDDPHGFIERVRPMYDELFQCAYALTGNLELAEYVLRSALLEAYLRRGEWRERMSFHEGIAYALRAVAMTELKRIRAVGGYEMDWTLPAGADLTREETALRDRVDRESIRTQRLMLLTYGCAMKANQTAQVLSISVPGVKEGQRRLLSRLQRALGLGRREMEARMESLSEKLLASPCTDAPACGQMLRAFERDAEGQVGRKTSAGRVAGVTFLIVGAILCALLFWLLTVLLEPRSAVTAPSAPPSAQAQNETNASTNDG